MKETIKCPHCNEPVTVDHDYSKYYHEECGNFFSLEDSFEVTKIKEEIKEIENELDLLDRLKITPSTNIACGYHIWSKRMRLKQLNKKLKEVK